MKRGVRIVNAARGDLVDLDALVDALESGQVGGAALDVFPAEPYTSGRILELPNVVVTPHLGASTHEAQDRAGVIVAEQVAAALTGEFVSNAVNIPHVGAEDMRVRRGREPLATGPGNVGQALAAGPALNGRPAVLLPPDRKRRVVSSARIGLTKGVDRPWRFSDPESSFVSRPISSAPRVRPRRTHA